MSARTQTLEPTGYEDMFELLEAVDNIIIAHAMGWKIDVAFERLRVAKARFDVSISEAP